MGRLATSRPILDSVVLAFTRCRALLRRYIASQQAVFLALSVGDSDQATTAPIR